MIRLKEETCPKIGRGYPHQWWPIEVFKEAFGKISGILWRVHIGAVKYRKKGAELSRKRK